MSTMNDIIKRKIQANNRRVRNAMKRAEHGTTINLTRLLISRERLEQEIEALRWLSGE
jgi:hypothetical protein